MHVIIWFANEHFHQLYIATNITNTQKKKHAGIKLG